jgi:hypothetical protein
MKNAGWELHHHCLRAAQPHHEQSIAGGGWAMEARNVDLVIINQARNTRQARHRGTTPGKVATGWTEAAAWETQRKNPR